MSALSAAVGVSAAHLLADGGLSGFAGDIAVPGGIAGAVAIILITLIKTRSTDRQELSKETQEHMDRLTTERNNAVTEREEVTKAKLLIEKELDQAYAARRAAEDLAREAQRQQAQSIRQSERLAVEIEVLKREIEQLKHVVAQRAEPEQNTRPRPGPGLAS